MGFYIFRLTGLCESSLHVCLSESNSQQSLLIALRKGPNEYAQFQGLLGVMLTCLLSILKIIPVRWIFSILEETATQEPPYQTQFRIDLCPLDTIAFFI